LVCRFVSGVPSGRTNNYPESGRGLGHVTPTIFGIRSNISLKLLQLETSNLIHGFVWAMPSRRINNFPESRRGIGHVTLQFLAVRSAILAPAWLLVFLVIAYCKNGWTYLIDQYVKRRVFSQGCAFCGWENFNLIFNRFI